MSTKKTPTISVTTEQRAQSESDLSDEDSYSNDMDYNHNEGGITDVEDFESPYEAPRSRRSSSVNGLSALNKKQNRDNDLTDIEDYNDSDSEDDEKNIEYPELKISLQEFLQQGLREQAIVNNEMNAKIEMKAGNFLQAQNLNATNDYLTDCEDYNTDSEIEYGCEKSVCVDLDAAVDGRDTVCVADGTRPGRTYDESDEYEDVSVLSDISDVASALSDVSGVGVRGMSEDEVLEMSGEEEECQISCSDSSLDEDDNIYYGTSRGSVPAIDVTFVGTTDQLRRGSATLMGSKSNFLEVLSTCDEVLTDVERLDDSTDDDEEFDIEDDNNQPIPHAIIASSDDGDCQTDTEILPFDEDSLSNDKNAEIASIAEDILPVPQREVILLKEDKYGDTITNVMPMEKDFCFGIYNNFNDGAATDSDDYSYTEDYEPKSALCDDISAGNLIEGEVTIANETLKPVQNKRTELHSNAESVTDVEELYVAGTNRRKKNKTRSMSKGKSKYLEVSKTCAKEEAAAATDIEDMDLSECGLPPNIKHTASAETQSTKNSSEKLTDVEDITADENSEDSDVVPAQVDANSLGLNEYRANSANIVLTLEVDNVKNCPKHASLKKTLLLCSLNDERCSQQNVTDVEDVQVATDDEDNCNNELPQVEECNCSYGQLNEMLNESYTVVHEKSGSSFDAEAEKLHIKGMPRDAHTDIEYVESDEPAARGGN